MTPDQILATLATCDGLPREAMKAAREHRDEMLPQFLAHIERLATATVDTVTDVDKDACLFVFHLLGEWRDPRAYRPLTRLLRVDPKLLDLVLGDGLTQCASRVIAGVFNGDLQPIFDVIEDPDADEFARSQMIDALVIIAHNDPSTRSAIVVYLAAFFDLDVPKPDVLWGSWAFAIADLGLAHLEPQVRHAFERELVSPDESTFDFFQEQLRSAVSRGISDAFLDGHNSKLIEDAVDELSRWYCFSDAYLKERAHGSRDDLDLPDYFSETFQREGPKVGRNDPCPCGSGKKFKKCCLH